MSLSPSSDAHEPDHAVPGARPEVEPTGNAAVDAVLESLAGLADRPVEEHVSVFEQAHERLRGALDAPAGPKPPVVPPAPGS